MQITGNNFIEYQTFVQEEIYKVSPSGLGYLQQMILAAFVELGELTQELPFKAGRDGLQPTHPLQYSDKAQEELIDVAIFITNIAIALGMSSQDFWKMMSKKIEINIERRLAANGTNGSDIRTDDTL